MDHCEAMLPPYLRFVKGVVESADLPLNVSREILQDNRTVGVIKKSITKKVLDTLAEMKKDEPEAYDEFYGQFGRILKEGIHHDFERKDAIAELLLFESTKTEAGKKITLAEYVERMPAEQKEIYYMTGPDRATAESSPYLEVFKEKGLEVLLMTDDIDDMIISRLGSYQEKEFQSAIKGDLDLGDSKKEEKQKEYGDLLEMMQEQLKDAGQRGARLGPPQGLGGLPGRRRARPRPADGKDVPRHGPGGPEGAARPGGQPRPSADRQDADPFRRRRQERAAQGVRRPALRSGAAARRGPPA